MYGGEEYELVVTVRSDSWKKAHDAVSQAGGTLIRIGEATREERIVLVQGNTERSIFNKGWEHFKS
jgi:thiamine monophosphate kinase